MAENLKVTHYKDGSAIPNITNNGDWNGLSTGAYGDYDNNPTNSETYGRLYNWYTVDDSRGVCPEGWHVPSDDELTVLTDYLGGESVAGGKMKESGHEHWNYYSDEITEEATNESGFTAIPNSWRKYDTGDFGCSGCTGSFWLSTEVSSVNARSRWVADYSSVVFYYNDNKHFGLGIRCLED